MAHDGATVRSPRRVLALAAMAALALVVPGCADTFERDADRQVKALVKDRQQTVLGYAPSDGTVGSPTDRTTTKRSYAALPTTRLPELGSEPVMLRRVQRQASTLGPSLSADPIVPKLPTSGGVDRAQRYVAGGYTLGPPVELGTAARFSLFDCLHYATNNSRTYQDQVEVLYESALNVTLQRHLFEPRPFMSASARYSGGQADSNYRSALSVSSQAGVRQRLPYGGEVVASALVSFVNALNETTSDGESARVALTASIPLLRGAGLRNLESLIASERGLIYAVRSFETYRRNFVVQISTQYFNLLTSQQRLRNFYVRYLDSIELTARTDALFRAGTIAALEVQRSQQELLSAEDAVNNAVQSYENALDDFKILLGMPVESDLSVVPIAIDVVDPDLDVNNIMATAKRFRLDLQTARDRVDDAKRRVDIARNDLLPDLNLNLDTGLGSREDRAREVDSRNFTYVADLTLDLPLDRLAERNRYRTSLIDLQQSQRAVVELEQNILGDMRSAARAIRSAQTSLELQRRGVEIARLRVENANISLLLGRSLNSRDVVEAQNSLLQAQNNFQQARSALQIQVLIYLRDTGQLRLDPASGQLGLAMVRGEPSAQEAR